MGCSERHRKIVKKLFLKIEVSIQGGMENKTFSDRCNMFVVAVSLLK